MESLGGATLHSGIVCSVVRLGDPASIEAGDSARQGSYSPDANMVLEGLMCQPPYLLGSETLGEGGSPTGKVELQRDWKRERDSKRDWIVCGLEGLPRW